MALQNKEQIENEFYSLAVSIWWKQSSDRFKNPLKILAWKWGWFWNPTENIIQYDEDEVEKKWVEYWKWIICHEGWHVAITRVEIYDEPVFKKIQKLTWMPLLINWVEDPRVNNYIISVYTWAWKWLKGSYDTNLRENMIAEYEKKWFKKADVSKHFSLIWWSIEYWHTGTFPQSDPEVMQVWNLVKDKILYCHSLYPNIFSSDEDRIILFKKVVAIIYKEIYPKFKYLLDKDMDESLQKALDQMQNWQQQSRGQDQWWQWQQGQQSGQQQSGGWAGSWMELDLDNLEISLDWSDSDAFDWKKQLSWKDLKEMMDKMTDYQKEVLQRKLREALNKASMEASKQMDGEAWKEQKEQVQREMNSSSWKEEMTDNLKEEIEAKEENSKEVSDEINSKESRKVMDEVAREMKKQLLDSQWEYYDYYNQVSNIIRECYNYLSEIFVEKNKQYVENYSSWARLNLKRALQSEMSGHENFNIWDRHLIREDRDYAVSFLLDTSGSMSWSRMENSFLALVVLAETLNLLWIPFEIYWFSDSFMRFKEFHDIWDDKSRKYLLWIRHYENSWTNDYTAVKNAVESLLEQDRTDSVLIVLTDWGSNNPARLKGELKKLHDNFWREWIWVWIWWWTDVERNYVDHVDIPDVSKLSLEISKIIKRQLTE